MSCSSSIDVKELPQAYAAALVAGPKKSLYAPVLAGRLTKWCKDAGERCATVLAPLERGCAVEVPPDPEAPGRWRLRYRIGGAFEAKGHEQGDARRMGRQWREPLARSCHAMANKPTFMGCRVLSPHLFQPSKVLNHRTNRSGTLVLV